MFCCGWCVFFLWFFWLGCCLLLSPSVSIVYASAITHSLAGSRSAIPVSIWIKIMSSECINRAIHNHNQSIESERGREREMQPPPQQHQQIKKKNDNDFWCSFHFHLYIHLYVCILHECVVVIIFIIIGIIFVVIIDVFRSFVFFYSAFNYENNNKRMYVRRHSSLGHATNRFVTVP